MTEPPCPACGAAMFGWAAVPKLPSYAAGPEAGLAIDRCEACGLGLLGGPPVELAAELGSGALVEGPNRSSLQAALGARGWALIDPQRRVYPTPAAAEAIAAKLGGRAGAIGTPLRRRAIWGMWQTLVNAFTLGTNVISDAWRGRQAPANGRERAALVLDLIVSALVAIPLLLIAVPLELAATAVGRGGITRFAVERPAA